MLKQTTKNISRFMRKKRRPKDGVKEEKDVREDEVD